MQIILAVNEKLLACNEKGEMEEREESIIGRELTKEEAIRGLQCSRPYGTEKYPEENLERFYETAKALGFEFVAW